MPAGEDGCYCQGAGTGMSTAQTLADCAKRAQSDTRTAPLQVKEIRARGE